MSFHYLVLSVRRRAWVVGLSVLVAAAIGLWFTLVQPQVYEAEVTCSILSTNPAGGPDVAIRLADALAPTLIAYMGTQTFAAQVILRTELSMTPTDLLSRVRVWHVPDTHLVKVRAVSNYPQQAERIANGVAETLVAITAEQLAGSTLSGISLAEPSAQAEQVSEELRYYQEVAAELRSRLAEFRAQAPSPERDAGIAALISELAQLQDVIHELRLTLQGMLAAGGTIAPYRVSILDPATVPLVPEPRPFARNVAVAIALGIVVGFAIALVPESVTLTVSTPEELEEAIPLSTLGAIARIGPHDGDDDPIEKLVARNYPRSPIAEAFRTLRTNIRFCRPDLAQIAVLLTSAQPGEGKTLVAANLAVAFAQEGRKTILVDGDLRRPSMHRFFGLPNRVGFTSLILDETMALEAALQDTDVPGLQLLPSGPLPPNPLDLLSSRRASQLFAELKRRCSALVIDSPPVLSVTDALLLAQNADAALLVVAARRTRKDVILRALQTLKRSGVDIIGAVLNMVRQSDLGYYYSHYYYGYYYASPDEVPGEIVLVGRMAQDADAAQERKG
jgi:non-specific protein-tyrosine kinase